MTDIEEYFHELLQHGQALTDMTNTPGWAHLVEACNQELFKRGDAILSGMTTDRETYIREAAFRNGILFVLDMVNRVTRQVAEAREQVAELHELQEA